MTTALQGYIDALYDSIEALVPVINTERSPTLAIRREDCPVVVVHRGAEIISDDSPWPMSTRHRQLLVTVHGAGDGAEDDIDAVFAKLQPIFANFVADGVVQLEELGTDEPKYANKDLTRALVTRRWRLTYQTRQDSLS